MRNLLCLGLGAMLLCGGAGAAKITLQNGQTGELGNQKIVVLSVKDSRCPADTRCIQAGELSVTVLSSQNNHLRLLKLYSPERVGAAWEGLRVASASAPLSTSRAPVRITLTDERP